MPPRLLLYYFHELIKNKLFLYPINNHFLRRFPKSLNRVGLLKKQKLWKANFLLLLNHF